MGFVIVCLLLSGCLMIDRGTTIPAPERSRVTQLSSADLGEEEVREMISRFGPLIYLRGDENYLMDDPEYVLDYGVSLKWGIVENATDYDTFRSRRVQSLPTSAATLADDALRIEETIQSSADPGIYKYWLHIDDKMKKGNMRRAKAQVRVLPADDWTTEIQFWFFYPFNGPGRVEVCAASTMCDDNWLSECGRHYGDWELVSILVSNNAEELISVYMSRHSGSETFDRWDDGTYRSITDSRRVLHFEGLGRKAHPIIYSAISSHAHYPSPGNHKYKRVYSKSWGLGTASADLFDRTDTGRGLRAYHPDGYRFISSDLPGFQVVEPSWLGYQGRWGQYEKLTDKVKFLGESIPVFTYKEIGNGPTGPKMKTEWSSAFGAH
jgi:hypothetical protein